MQKIEDLRVKKENLEIHYEDWINNENTNTIIILHWWWWSSQSWLSVWEILFSRWYNVIIPDLPWFWKTKLNKVHDLDEYATIVEEFIKDLGLDNIILWWHSNWWAIAIKIANRNKIKISRLVLNNSAWIRNDKKRGDKRKVLTILVKIFKPLKKVPGFNYIRTIFYRFIWWQDYLASENNPYMKQTYLNMIKSDLQDIVPDISQNTLLIWWEKDTYTPLSDGLLIRKMIKNSKMIVLENEKHWIHITSPEKLVITFLNNI